MEEGNTFVPHKTTSKSECENVGNKGKLSNQS